MWHPFTATVLAGVLSIIRGIVYTADSYKQDRSLGQKQRHNRNEGAISQMAQRHNHEIIRGLVSMF